MTKQSKSVEKVGDYFHLVSCRGTVSMSVLYAALLFHIVYEINYIYPSDLLNEVPISLIAIYLGGEYNFDEILEVLDVFIAHGRLQEAHGLYLTLMDRFPHVSELVFFKIFKIHPTLVVLMESLRLAPKSFLAQSSDVH